MRRAVSLLLAALLLLAPAAAARAEDTSAVTIGTAEEFAAFALRCARESYSLGRRFVLTADIDLSGLDFESAPWFAGSFDGGGHSVGGLKLSGDGSRQGLFRTVAAGASVANLHVSGEVAPGGTAEYVGGLAGVNEGEILYCSFRGEVRGLNGVGGLVGLNAPSGVVRGSGSAGTVQGEHRVGGLAGLNEGRLEDCESRSEVNTAAFTPSGEPRFDLASFSQEDFVDLSDIGGIAGENRGALLRCRNRGAVGYPWTGYNVGGVAGKSSGFVGSCENEGAVEGRRDTGGIVGQLIPYAAWEFTNEQLETLADAVGYLHYLLNELNAGTDKLSGELCGQLQGLNGSAVAALNALAGLITGGEIRVDGGGIDPETGEIRFPDLHFDRPDTTALTQALNDLFARSGALTDSMIQTAGDLAGDVKDISHQVGYIFNLLLGLLRDAGKGDLISRTDLSYDEAYAHDEGAVADCRSYGPVRAETNAGGVVGSIAFEISFDMEDQLHASNLLATHAEQFLFAAVRACGSRAEVVSRSDCAGGIVGRMELGAVVDCAALGAVSSQTGDYAGGIAGSAKGTLARCWARTALEGRRYVGGIAGLGDAIRDCRAWTHIARASEYAGAVAGWAEGEVSGNLYAESRPEGVDGVSRIGQTEALSRAAFLALPGAPAGLDQVQVRFVVEGETVQTQSLPFGAAAETLPAVPDRGRAAWVWDGTALAPVYADCTVSGRYVTPDSTLATGEAVPQFLVEGEFREGQSLQATPCEALSAAGERVGGWTLRVPDYEGTLTVRMRHDPDVKLYTPRGESWEELAVRTDGQYLVFELPNGASFLMETVAKPFPWHLVMAGSGAALLVLLLVLRSARRKRKKRTAAGR